MVKTNIAGIAQGKLVRIASYMLKLFRFQHVSSLHICERTLLFSFTFVQCKQISLSLHKTKVTISLFTQGCHLDDRTRGKISIIVNNRQNEINDENIFGTIARIHRGRVEKHTQQHIRWHRRLLYPLYTLRTQ